MAKKDNLKPTDLGNGYRLIFRESAKNSNVRAVVRDPNGDICTRGPVVARKLARNSAMIVTTTKPQPWLNQPEPPDEEEEEEDGEEEEGDEYV